MPSNELGTKIKNARLEKKWNIEELIKNLNFPNYRIYTPTYMNSIESKVKIPSAYLICKMAITLELDAKELLSLAKSIRMKEYEEGIEENYQKALKDLDKGKIV